jgi:predicted enzyme related to lactoylglutathione lyase
MEKTSYEHGVPSWIDIGTPDLPGAAEFYGRLFGWEAPEGDEATGFYRNAFLNGKTVAGLGPQMNPDMPPYWTTYVNVTDSQAIADKVTAAGGTTIVPPMQVMEHGTMAIYADPQGAAFGTWQPGKHIGAQLVNEPGALSWNELQTTDIDGARDFYAAVFGWGAKTNEGPFPYTEFQVGGGSIAGGMPQPPGTPEGMPPFWAVYFAVADLEATLASVKELGGQVLMDGMDSPAGRFAAVTDPQGGSFCIIQLTR